MEGIDINVPYKKETTRVEMIYRCLYCIAYCVIASFVGTIMCLIMTIQFLIMIITATRHDKLNHYIHVYLVWITDIAAYLYLLTDERPNLIPKF
jgi:tryptophan-rich sensory protein